jgi:hypothetical protein
MKGRRENRKRNKKKKEYYEHFTLSSTLRSCFNKRFPPKMISAENLLHQDSYFNKHFSKTISAENLLHRDSWTHRKSEIHEEWRMLRSRDFHGSTEGCIDYGGVGISRARLSGPCLVVRKICLFNTL